MSKSNHSEAQMIGALKQLEAGRTAEDIGRELGVSKHTIYAWKAKYGGMSVSEAQEAKQLREENTRLKKLVVDLSLDREMLKAVIAKNGWSSRRPAVGCELAARGVCGQRAPGLRAADDGGGELPLCGGGRQRRSVAGATGGAGAVQAAFRVSAAACVAAAKWRACESQAGASGVSGSRVDAAAEEAETLRARGQAAGAADSGEPGVGAGFCARRGGVRAGDPGAERGRRLHAGMSGAGSGHQFRQPESDPGVGCDHRRAGQACGDSLRQRAGVHQPAFSGVGGGAGDRVESHSAGQADAERAGGKFSRTVAGRVFAGELVSESVRRAVEGGGVAERVQPGAPAQQFGIPHAEQVCGGAGGGLLPRAPPSRLKPQRE
jgi:putative transposase